MGEMNVRFSDMQTEVKGEVDEMKGLFSELDIRSKMVLPQCHAKDGKVLGWNDAGLSSRSHF